MTITQSAEHFGLTIQELFNEAHKVYGAMFGLQPPDTLHILWKRGLICTPITVEKYIQRRLDQEARLLVNT